jgi:methionyl-tRNA formyltransferase
MRPVENPAPSPQMIFSIHCRALPGDTEMSVNETTVVVITGSERRHRFFTERLAERVNVVGVVSEMKRPTVARPESLSPEDAETIRAHFAERDAAEQRLLGSADLPSAAPILKVAAGVANSDETTRWVQDRDPKFIVLYGSGIIKPPLLNLFEGRIVNLHLGLSPYYRGSGTNFWPLVHRVPECVGGTIHLANQEVDAGAILMQFRPNAELTDRGHELGTKTIIKGAELMSQVLKDYESGNLVAQRQDLSSGSVFFNRDFNAAAVRTAWQHFETGMMAEYLGDEQRRNSLFPIFEGCRRTETDCGSANWQTTAKPSVERGRTFYDN